MIFNKSYFTTFSKNKPYLALASKGKILDSKFTFTSELSLYDYSLDKHFPALQTDNEYCKLVWCEKEDMQILATGHTNGSIFLYEPDTTSSFKLLKSFDGLSGKVMGIDYNASKNVIAVGSSDGNIIFWNLDKIDQQYKCDIPITENITSLAWNNKVSKILCVGTECGKIIVLDIRLKRIAMTLQYQDIKTINNIRWHSKSSTSLFASTNLNCLLCFKLDSNSKIHIGEYGSSPVNFSIINKDTVVRYTENNVDYIDVESLIVRESIKIENAFNVSFSSKDPLYCCSYNNGTTELFTSSVSSISVSNPHVQLNNCIIGSKIYSINDNKFEIQRCDNIESKILSILYDKETFKFDIETRKVLGKIFLDESDLFKNEKSCVENDGIIFNLKDKLIRKLIKNEKINPEDEDLFNGRSISLKSFFNLLVKNKSRLENDSLVLLLSLIVNKDYTKLWKSISSKQLTVTIAILLYSDLSDDQVLEKIREIQAEYKLPILNLMINEPSNFFNAKDITSDLPKNMFDVKPFFKKYGGEITNLKKLSLKYDSPIINEYFWFAKNHGMYKDLKNIMFEDYIIKTYINKQVPDQSNIIEKEVSNVSSKVLVSKIQSKPLPDVLTHSDQNPLKTKSISSTRSSLYSNSTNRSVTSFSTKPVPKPSGKGENSHSALLNPAPPKKSLYSGVLNRSVTSFSTKPESAVSTYAQQSSSSTRTSPSIALISTPIIPNPNISSKKQVLPQTSNRTTPVPNNTILEPVPQSNYDFIVISRSLEEKFEILKLMASKKNNLIIANKIKDAVRRFSIFQQIDKKELSTILLEKIQEILQVLNNENNRNMIKQRVRSIIDECIEIKNCQSDIWMPAIAILVQLVY